jgi:diguanylate cyclase (GGDEF)-like protein
MLNSRIALLRANCERLLAQLSQPQTTRISLQERVGEPASAVTPQAASLSAAAAEASAEACEYARRLGERFAAGQRPVEELISQLLQAGRPSQQQFHQQAQLVTAGVKAYLNTVTGQLTEQAQRDALTKLFNRAVFDQRVREELSRAQRYQREFALVLFDLDQFKQVNDQLGHLVGAEVLQRFAGFLRASLRQTDSAFRYGGDEFAALLPETGVAAARHVLERLEQRWVEDCRREPSRAMVGMSFGVAAYPQDAPGAVALLKVADARLYEHKRTHLREAKYQLVSEGNY